MSLSKNSGFAVITVKADNDLNFNSIASVGAEHVLQALQMAQVFQQAINQETLEFEFDKALQLVQQNPKMAVVGTLNQTIQQSSNLVSAMVDQLIKLLNGILMVNLQPAEKEKYELSITEAFTNLAPQQSEAWIFWSKTEAHKTSYQYNIFFAIQNASTGSVMFALPIGLNITVDIQKEKVLFITLKDKQSYSVQVKALQVAEALRS